MFGRVRYAGFRVDFRQKVVPDGVEDALATIAQNRDRAAGETLPWVVAEQRVDIFLQESEASAPAQIRVAAPRTGAGCLVRRGDRCGSVDQRDLSDGAGEDRQSCRY